MEGLLFAVGRPRIGLNAGHAHHGSVRFLANAVELLLAVLGLVEKDRFPDVQGDARRIFLAEQTVNTLSLAECIDIGDDGTVVFVGH